MEQLELALTLVSVAAAALGLFLAWLLYYRRPRLPQQITDALGGLYRAVLNKYYVDELYATLFVKPLVDGSTRILWHTIDQGVIDTSVDESADGARHVSDTVRRMQSGNIRSYAAWVATGAAGVIAYMIWMGVR
jgi:NADH-quinone oxidoreductase subunit L